MKRESAVAALAPILLLSLFSSGIFAAEPAAGSLTLPPKPNFARVKAVSPFEIDLTWRDRSSNEDGYQIERSTDRTHFRQIARVLPGATIYRDKNLFPATRYFYRIRAFNASGNSHYSTTSARTRTPVVPLSIAEWGTFWYGTVAPTNTDLVSVSAGVYHSLGLKKDGTVIAWGDNGYGESTVPTNLTDVVAISAGQFDSLALKSDGTVVEWGYGGSFLGTVRPTVIVPEPILVQPTNRPPQRPIPPTPSPTELLSSQQFTSRVAPRPSTQSRVLLPNDLTGVVAISAGNSHNLALKGDGTVIGWGNNFYGQAAPPTNLFAVVEIAAGDTYSLALRSDGTVVQWGNLDPEPTNLTSVVALEAGPGLAMAVKSDGTIVAWGNNSSGTTQTTSNLIDVTAIALATFQGAALKKDGTLFWWDVSYPSAAPPDLGTGTIRISGGGSDHFVALSIAPTAPSNPFVTILSPNQLRLSWHDNSRDEKSFAIERTDSNFTPWARIGTAHANTTNFTDTTAQPGIVYSYRVRAINKFGTSSSSSSINAMLAPPTTPNELSATLGDTNQVNLAWYDAFSGIDRFEIERALDNNGAPGTWSQIASDTASNFVQNTFTDSTAQPNVEYWYRVRAANILGFSDYCDAVSINVAPPPMPQYLNGSPFADSASFYWSDAASARGSKIERAPDVNGAPGAWIQIATLDATNGSQYIDVGLSVNTTYWYRVRAYNWVGDSDYTPPLQITIVPPAPPYSVSVAIGRTDGVDVSWEPAVDDEDGFKLERAPDAGGRPGPWTEIASFNDVHASYESFHDTNILANNIYWYRVRAFNLFGFSDYSTPISISVVPPPAPTLFAAISLANTVNLHWQTTAQNLLGFKIERAPDADGGPGAWTEIANQPFGNYTDANLTGGATYWYRIRSFNWIGDSPYSGLTAVTIDPPAAPEFYSAILNPTNGVNLGLRQNAGDEEGFLIERAVPTDLGFMNWTQIAIVNWPGAATVTFVDTNAVPNSTNYYRLRAFNTVGVSDYSAVVSIAVTPPTPPYLSTSSRSGTVSVGIFPHDLAAEADLGYRLQRAPDAGGHPGTWTQIAALAATGANASYTDAGFAVGTAYWYRAQAFNWVGDSDFSEAFPVTMSPPGKPSQLSAWLSITNHQADLYWYDQFPDEDGFTIERAPDVNGNPGSWSQIGILYETNSFSNDFSDTNVTANTTNWYRVRAFDTASVSEYSDATRVSATAPAPPTLLGKISVNAAKLSWYDASPSGSSVTGYELQRALDNNGAPGAWTQLTNLVDSQYTDQNLSADTTYWYRLRSHNWVGDSDYSEPLSLTVIPPERPDGLIAGLGTTNSVVLQWYDYRLDKDGFKIERAGDAGGYPGDDWQEIGSFSSPFSFQYSFVDTNVTANTTNWYRVRAFGPTGYSDYDGDAEARIMPPDAPQNLSASPSRNIVQVGWDFNSGIGANGGFVLQRAADAGGIPGVWADISTNTPSATYYTDSGLSPGIYWYRVRAFNWVGSSDYDSAVSATILQITAPAKPDAPYAYMIATNNEVSMYWYDDASDEDGFRIQRAADVEGAPGSWTEIGTIYATNSYYAEFTDTNVAANSTNWYRVQAFNSAGVSEFSDSNSVDVIPPVAAPLMTPASVISAHRIDIRWEAEYEFIQGYKIERSLDNAGTPGAWTLLVDLPSADTAGAYSDLAVVMNHGYWYRVQSYNWCGASPYSDPVLIVDAPTGPPSLTVANDQPHQFTLNWSITNNDIASIKIERAPDSSGAPGAWIQIAEPLTYCGLIPTNYTDVGIPTGATYWYRVRAVNAVGDSPYSNEASATEGTVVAPNSALMAQPQILSLTQTNGGMLIQWSTMAGSTDVVQAAGNLTGDYTDISPALVVIGTGTVITNYVDAGAPANTTSRFYRIKSSR